MSASAGRQADYGLGWVAYFLRPEEDRAAEEAWKRKGKCYSVGPEMAALLFFPPLPDPHASPSEQARMASEAKARTREGKRFCNGDDDGAPCPVRMECLGYALEERLWEGVYGGTSGRERRKYSNDLLVQVVQHRSRKRRRRSQATG